MATPYDFYVIEELNPFLDKDLNTLSVIIIVHLIRSINLNL